jgi:hypothetical protein
MGAILTFTTSEKLTSAAMNQIVQMDVYATAVSSSVNPAVAGSFYIVTTSSSNLTVTLPSPTQGICIGVKKTDSGAGTLTITAGSGVIYGPGTGSSGSSSIPCSAQGAYVVLQGDGTNWHIVAGQQDSGWVTPSYTNSFNGFQYRLTGNVVRLMGLNTAGSSGNPAFTLPSGYRPFATRAWALTNNGAVTTNMIGVISPGGVVTPTFASGTGVYLDPVTFTVD